MADQDDFRRIALALPEAHESPDAFHFGVAGNNFAWVWLGRPDPKGARVSNPDVLVS